MQAAATTIRLLKGRSSKAGFADSESVVSNDHLLQHLVASHLVQAAGSQGLLLNLATSLIQVAEQAYLMRDLDALEEVSHVLMNLPVDAVRQVGLYYGALAVKRKGNLDKAKALLETVADNAPIAYRARAIQSLGALHYDKGQLNETLRLQLEALRAAPAQNAQGLQTKLMAQGEIAILRSLAGDHKGALSILEKLWPLACDVAKHQPFYFYLFHNELAIELGEVGRIEEAKAACRIALASPFAAAYPEWSETRDELATKLVSATPSVVAVNRAPEATPSAQPERERNPERLGSLAFLSLRFNRTSLRGGSKPIAATSAIFSDQTTHSILDQVLSFIGPRAPPVRP